MSGQAMAYDPQPSTGRVFRADVDDDDLEVEVHSVAAPVAVVRRRDALGVARFARYLAAHFGKFMPSRKRRPGRERMVQVLVERCEVPRRRARAMINELEERSLIRFVRGDRRNGFVIKTA
ncbi:MAG: hypothetical protein CMN30_16940 [Sandaracinus sp.]|nr:hypothetical protein [Sandaracinus sp.]|tara:strand:- start:24 stop:386 length:363 start_codon:yes stop_codon:yes gene_type:complete